MPLYILSPVHFHEDESETMSPSRHFFMSRTLYVTSFGVSKRVRVIIQLNPEVLLRE